MKQNWIAMAAAAVLLFGLSAPAAGQKPIDGDYVDEACQYQDVGELPWEGENKFELVTAKTVLDAPDGVNDTTTNAVVDVTEDGKITMKRTGQTGSAVLKKYLTDTARYKGSQTLEFEYEKIGKAKLYIQVEGFGSYRGPITFDHTADNKFSPYGQAAKAVTASKVKVTLQLRYESKTLDVYVNNARLYTNVPYRNQNDADYKKNYDVGKLGIKVEADTAKGCGVKLNYVRLMETAAYDEIEISKDCAFAEAFLPDNKTIDTEQRLELKQTEELSYDNEITWQSSDPQAIDPVSGTVRRHQSENRGVTLTMQLRNRLTGTARQFRYRYEVLAVVPPELFELVARNLTPEQMSAVTTGGTVKAEGGLELERTGAGELSASYAFQLGDGFPATRKIITECIPAGNGELVLTGLDEAGNSLPAMRATIDGDSMEIEYGGEVWTGETGRLRLIMEPELKTISIEAGEDAPFLDEPLEEAVVAAGSLTVSIPEEGTRLSVSDVSIYTDTGRLGGMFSDGLTIEKVTGGTGIGQTEPLFLPKTFCGAPVVWTADRSGINFATGAVTKLEEYGSATISLRANVELDELSFEKEIPIVLLGSDPRSVSTGKPVSTNAKLAEGSRKENLTDGTPYYVFETEGGESGFSVTVDLGEKSWINKIMADENGAAVGEYTAEVSEDNRQWTAVAEGIGLGSRKMLTFSPCEARYVRLKIESKGIREPARLAELAVLLDQSPQETVSTDCALLELTLGSTVNGNLSLPRKGRWGSDIVWTSSAPEVISADGEYTAPASDRLVTLTADLTCGEATAQKRFQFTVEGLARPQPPSGGGGSGGTKKNNGLAIQLIPPVPEQQPEQPQNAQLTDLDDVLWAKQDILRLAELGIVEGDNGRFRPAAFVTREEFVKLLVIALEIEAEEAPVAFNDVEENAWYKPYLSRAAAAGIVTGESETHFGTGGKITRQDMAVMVERALKVTGNAPERQVAYNGFADEDEVSSYALDSVVVLYECGLISGRGDNRFCPNECLTRAEAAHLIGGLVKGRGDGE